MNQPQPDPKSEMADAIAAPVSQGYICALNVSSLVDATSFEVTPGHHLRHATPEESVFISETIRTMAGGVPPAPIWEYRKGEGVRFERMVEADWRYFVIAFRGTNAGASSLELSCSLAPIELETAFTVLSNTQLAWHPGRVFQLLDSAHRGNFALLNVTGQMIQAITDINRRLLQHGNRLPDVAGIAAQLLELKALPFYSPLRFLGYFALLESILVHQPRPSDPYDSITRQVKQKVALLNNRWQPMIDYAPFRGLAPEKVWTKMYAYRSQLAHGGAPTLAGDLAAALGSYKNALNLIKETVKATIRHALIDPQLLVDLRDC